MEGSFRSPVRNGTAVLHSENKFLNPVKLCESLPASKEMKREILHAELRWVLIELNKSKAGPCDPAAEAESPDPRSMQSS